MADWKQITARIRRAKGSKDPAGQLCNLFQKTRDAMVAFELARHFEIVSKPEDAAKWYALSWQRFRRGDWKTKAQDAITRLGGSLPAEGEILSVPEIPRTESSELQSASANGESETPSAELPVESQSEVESAENSEATPAIGADSSQSAAGALEKRGRRRGRRGGRNRRKANGASEQAQTPVVRPGAHAPARTESADVDADVEVAPPRVVDARSIPRVPVEAAIESGGPGVKGRFGDPGLSSRLSVLEMQFRRLLTCTAVKLDQADRAPAGPGVFVLTDDDMTTYYYVEACDTLRIAIGNVARGGNRRTGINVKPLLADHLGIPEARVSKYLSEHCVVRWLQLDEGAEHFAHFAIAVLRPSLNAQNS